MRLLENELNIPLIAVVLLSGISHLEELDDRSDGKYVYKL